MVVSPVGLVVTLVHCQTMFVIVLEGGRAAAGTGVGGGTHATATVSTMPRHPNNHARREVLFI